jgi:hypothetical protein
MRFFYLIVTVRLLSLGLLEAVTGRSLPIID